MILVYKLPVFVVPCGEIRGTVLVGKMHQKGLFGLTCVNFPQVIAIENISFWSFSFGEV